MDGKYVLTTLGCKVNQYESQHIREVLHACGLRPAEPGEPADIAVVNTCAVTANASRKSRQAIRKLADGGKTSVYVVGCGATEDREGLARIPGVTAVFGHDDDISSRIHIAISAWTKTNLKHRVSAKNRPPRKKLRSDAARNDLWMKAGASDRNLAPTPSNIYMSNNTRRLSIVNAAGGLDERIEQFDGHQRAFLKVQDGCDAFCSYCIIPKLRSTMKSKPVDMAVGEAQRLVRSGHKEIILTGIFLGAFGRDTALRRQWGDGPSPLAALVDALASVEGLARLRLSSLEPGDVDDDLLDVLSSHDNCVPHLHLPLQSGGEGILRRMNRQYSRDEFMGMVDRVRERLDRPAITSDIIVGFPGETDADFQASLDIARYSEFCKIHAFPFSPREKTAASRWRNDFLPRSVVRERMQRLADVERECSMAYRRRFIGTLERVIVEYVGEDEEASQRPHLICRGRTDRYFEVHFDSTAAAQTGGDKGDIAVVPDGLRPGDIVHVRVDRVTPARTHGTLIRMGLGMRRPAATSAI